MSLPLLHAGRTNPGLSAALDLRFALDKSLTAYRGPTPSFSRASTGTFFNSSGVLTSASINTPRFNHTYNGASWVSKGLLIEEQRTNLIYYSNTFSVWQLTNATITSDNTTAPDGTSNGDLVTFTASGSLPRVVQWGSFSNSSGIAYTKSIYIKSGTQRYFQMVWSGGFGAKYANFDTQDKAVGTVSSGVTASVTDCGNGWYRYAATITAASSSTNDQFWIYAVDSGSAGWAPSSTSGGTMWLFGAQCEAGGFPSTFIPSDSGSATTRSADVCQITGSNFSSFWNATEGSIAVEYDRIINTGVRPLYSIFDSAESTNLIYQFPSGGNESCEVWVSNSPQCQLAIGSTPANGTTGKSAFAFKQNDFAGSLNGAAVVTDTSGSLTVCTQMKIGCATTNYLNGHIARLRYFNKRLPNATLQLLSEPDPTLNLQFALNKTLTPVAGPAPSFSRASTGTFFNASGVLTSASINTPRFDHVFSGGQWVSRGLLIEEQRTNICLQSNVNNTSPWSQWNETCTPNAAVAPDGTNTAALLVENTANDNHYHRQTSITLSAGTYTVSVYAKAKERYIVAFGGAATGTKYFNLQNGTVGATISGSPTATITDVGNGWYRLTVTGGSYAGGTSEQIQIFLTPNSETNLYTGNGTSGAYFWGAQIELGSFSTSLVPTTTSSVVRSADVCQITGTSFNWMWNQGEGSVAFEADTFSNSTAVARYYYFDDSATGNQIIGAVTLDATGNTGGDYVASYAYTGSYQALLLSQPARTLAKSAFGWKLNDFASSLNGSAAITDLSGSIPTGINRLALGATSGSAQMLNGHIAKLVYYPARLTNTKLQQLST